ncbi:hypothetical protein FRB94_011817 [Tulasnella sp. JGI-2019a]|nr:hypothetical protein FRB94_011817 [Tulasnella sp. JGI-2019a]
MHDLRESNSSDVLAALIGINSLPSHLLEPYDGPDDGVRSSPGIHCRVAVDSETNHRTTVWISKSYDRTCQNITIFDGWRICVQIPTADWSNRTYNSEDVRRAALLCMGRQYLSESAEGEEGPGPSFINVKEGADLDITDPNAIMDRRRVARAAPPPQTSSSWSSTPNLSIQIPFHHEVGAFSSAHTAEHGHEDLRGGQSAVGPSASPCSPDTPTPSVQFIRPSAPEPFTPAPTVENGHEPPEGHVDVVHPAPKPISSFFLVSQTDITIRSPPAQNQTQMQARSNVWWRRVMRVPMVPKFRRLSIRRRLGGSSETHGLGSCYRVC